MRDSGFCPYCPLTQQTAHNSKSLAAKIERRPKIVQDVIVVTGVQRDLGCTARLGHSANHIDGPIAVERCNLDGNHVFDFHELTPEFIRQQSTSHIWLQVKAHDRNYGRDSS